MSSRTDVVKKATDENRLISLREGNIRKTIGTVMLAATVLAFVLLPPIRQSYGPLSLAVALSIGTFRTGYQSL